MSEVDPLREDESLLVQLAAVARELAEPDSLDATLQLTVDRVDRMLDACEGASVMLIEPGGHVTTPAFSTVIAYKADQVQFETGEGPCLGAMDEHEVKVVDDLEAETRWPAWSEDALALGVRSIVSYRLFVSGDTMGALNVYATRPGVFAPRAQAIGFVLASHASVAVKAAIEEQGLERALRTRDVIGQAKGILMERQRLTADQAFERLREIAVRRQLKLRDVATRIAQSGEVPEG